MYRRVRDYMRENRMIEAGDTVVAGVSGGGDSMAMLSFLRRYQRECPFSLCVVHVHHGIRGAEADRDMELVRGICAEWELPFHARFYDVPLLAEKWKMGTEEAARKVRREAFAEEIKALGPEGKSARIAIAHNCNDLAETMLHHLARGTGIRGLCSMRPRNGNIIRPVLCLEREEIAHYLKENHIPCVTDSTNLSDDYTRNRIRHHVLPFLAEQINPQTAAHMAETARILAQAEDYLTGQGEALLQRCPLEKEGYLLAGGFFKADPAVQAYALQQAFGKLAGRRKDFTSLHVKSVLELREKGTGKRISLPCSLFAERTYQGIRLGKKSGESADTEQSVSTEEWELSVPGTLECPLGTFRARTFPCTGQKIEEKKCTKWLNYDKIYNKICVRTRRPGDFLIVDSGGSKKKLSRIMIDEKIPLGQRDDIPVLAMGQEILWIAGGRGRINEKYKIVPGTESVLELNCEGGSFHE